MGLAATIASGTISIDLVAQIATNPLLYSITAAVFTAGFLFNVFRKKMDDIFNSALTNIPFRVYIFLVIILLGILSSIITAIIASLILAEIIHILPLSRKEKIRLTVTACFSIGLGAALTPIGEPLSTIVVSKLNTDFWYLLREIGLYIIPAIIVLGILGVFCIDKNNKLLNISYSKKNKSEQQLLDSRPAEKGIVKQVSVRAIKIFIFIIALELLGAGYKPLIDEYIINLDSMLLYWINIVSAVLDNATLAAAETSPMMSSIQIQAILMALLVSGGMLIPGNIPNIISAEKIKIKSREWASVGIPMGLIGLLLFFVIIFLF
jgi:predicted cation transporter